MEASLFNKDMVEKVGLLTMGLFRDYLRDIEKAYLNTDASFSVAIRHKLSPRGNDIKIDAEISFVAERISDSATGFVTRQMSLPEDNGKKPLPPLPGFLFCYGDKPWQCRVIPPLPEDFVDPPGKGLKTKRRYS